MLVVAPGASSWLSTVAEVGSSAAVTRSRLRLVAPAKFGWLASPGSVHATVGAVAGAGTARTLLMSAQVMPAGSTSHTSVPPNGYAETPVPPLVTSIRKVATEPPWTREPSTLLFGGFGPLAGLSTCATPFTTTAGGAGTLVMSVEVRNEAR